MEISKCCEAPVTVGGSRSTHWYICLNCWLKCDLKEFKDKNKKNLKEV